MVMCAQYARIQAAAFIDGVACVKAATLQGKDRNIMGLFSLHVLLMGGGGGAAH